MKSFMRRINKYDLIKQGVFPEEEILAQCYDLPEAFEIQKLYEELKDAFEELKDKESRAEALAKLVRIRQKSKFSRCRCLSPAQRKSWPRIVPS